MKPIYLAQPRGFCAGVQRAVSMAVEALAQYPHPVFCLNEIVHNQTVVEEMTRSGMHFVRSLEEVTPGAHLLFSAHGVSPLVRRQARERNLKTIDATCPFVTKVHNEVRRFARAGYTVLLIGKHGHDEVTGVAGEAPDQVVVVENESEALAVRVKDLDKVAVVSQTTLSVEEADIIGQVLARRFPSMATPLKSDICSATSDRQNAVKKLAGLTGHILVLGSPNSSNTMRLVETGKGAGAASFLVESRRALDKLDLVGMPSLGITAGASTPESFINDIVRELVQRGFSQPAQAGNCRGQAPPGQVDRRAGKPSA